jgi:TRAP-type transport system small permease protein
MPAVSSRTIAITRAGDRIVALIERVLAVALIAGILFDFANVIGRYSGSFSILGIDELEIYVVIWIAFLGAVAVAWRGRHLRMDMLQDALPRALKSSVILCETLVTFVVCGFVGFQSFVYVTKLFALGSVSDILGVPTWIPHSAVCLSLSGMALIAFLRVVRLFVKAP